MKKSNSICFALVLTALPSGAATVSVSATAPVVDGADIANLSGTVNVGGDLGHIWADRPHHGQTFTTGANPAGYLLSSVTLRNENNNITSLPVFNVLVGSFSGTVLTQIGSTESATAPAYAPSNFITFNFTSPILLNPSTQYGFLWGSAGNGFVTLNNTDDATYTGGTAISSGDNNVPNLTNVISQNVERVFHVDLVAVPEPSVALLGCCSLLLGFVRRR